MRNLIDRCLSFHPSQRPSFEAILNELEMIGWAMLADADTKAIAEAVSEVNGLESRLTH
jgi:hypothetical protein